MDSQRKICPNSRSFTGRVTTSKSPDGWVAFESNLERDALYRFDALLHVASIHGQPVKIPHKTHLGNKGSYTPDFLVKSGQIGQPVLIEVKYRQDLFDDWPKLKPKFKAARSYCRENGWKFRILTEVEIRNTFLDNITFLRGYKARPHTRHREKPFYEDEIRAVLSHTEYSTPKALVEGLYPCPSRQAGVLSALWGMLQYGGVLADLSQKLTMNSMIWLPDNTQWTAQREKEYQNVWGK